MGFLVFTPRVVGVSTWSPAGLLCCPAGMKGSWCPSRQVPWITVLWSSGDTAWMGLRVCSSQQELPKEERTALADTAFWATHTWCRARGSGSLSELVLESSSCRMSPAPVPAAAAGERWDCSGVTSVPLPMESIPTNRCTPALWLLSVFHLSPSACPSVSLVCFLFAVLCVCQRDIS